MKRLNRHKTPMETMFNRYHHYILVGICLLLIAASMTITGCDINNSNDNDNQPERPTATSDELVPLPFFVRTENGNKIDPETTDADMPLITDLGRKPVIDPDGEPVTWGE